MIDWSKITIPEVPEDASAVDVWKMIETLAEQNGGKLPR